MQRSLCKHGVGKARQGPSDPAIGELGYPAVPLEIESSSRTNLVEIAHHKDGEHIAETATPTAVKTVAKSASKGKLISIANQENRQPIENVAA